MELLCTTTTATAAGDLWARGIGGGFSHESEHDLALMVSDFLENGSAGTDSLCSSDSDSGFSDLAHLADKISVISFLNRNDLAIFGSGQF